ncbi:AAA family ATPase [Pseudomonas aeruginosa]|uniref:AAA family ATPase n=1 Tax=Pseudomonas aeruginosa TaxID=287 RepID=UPI0024BE8E20|nr:AAA family ATPase [Pseudomonas aeruginosa]MDJ1424466.1 AAA family ATPase [Pseudomonas aeruginosa]HEH8637262.1 AAA family ATPase [Pseudomonas aeruginosa]
MSLSVNADFSRLLDYLKAQGASAQKRTEDSQEYRDFLQAFPLSRLNQLTLDEYCVGKGDGKSFCWWIERGLVPVLGRYMPGTARGHILYFQPDGKLYKNRRLSDLSDEQALRYTLAIQSTIAAADPADMLWVDDDQAVYQRAGVAALVTVGEGRKLRLLSCYHPEETLPISSSEHLGHYLKALGCAEQDIPSIKQPVARLMKLRDYFLLAAETVPGLSPYGFVRGLYSDELGLAPVKEEVEYPDSGVFVPVALPHGGRAPWGQITHVRLLGRKADTPKAQESLDFIQARANLDGVAALKDLVADFPGRLLSTKGQLGAMRFDLRHFANARESGDNPQDKGLVELGYMSNDPQDESESLGLLAVPHNQILFGPPGTGKTYATIEGALQILDQPFLHEHQGSRSALKQRFDELVLQDRIRFVTFHQSFSYEDFVEGLRATTDEATGQLRYEVVDGVFKSLCEAAAAKVTQQTAAPTELGQRRIWKMSLGNTLGVDASIYEECLAGGYVLLGYGGAIDFSGCTKRQEVQARFAQAGVTPENPATDYGITSVTTFVSQMSVGDLIVVSDGNFKFRAIAEVTGDYLFKPHAEFDDGYAQMRPVKWLRQYQPSLPHTELLNGQFSQMTLYQLKSPTLDRDKLKALLGATSAGGAFATGQVFGRDYQVVRATPDLLELKKPNGNLLPFSMSLLNELAAGVRLGKITLQDIREKTAIEKLQGSSLEPYLVNGYNNILAPLVEHVLGAAQSPASPGAEGEARVLIIDEINRGNISRIFGELITLIEPSKRAGADEALSVVLPYSKQPFSVPSNLYLIGTMNTADRSLAGLDIALRRRFVFREMPPQPELLNGVMVEQAIDIGQLLRVMNQRIEVLLDRDHCLGHAYFMSLKGDASLARLAVIFRNLILPLLQEYFFEDWERISWVLNDQQAESKGTEPFIQRPHSEQSLVALFGSQVAEKLSDQRWELNDKAFRSLDSYLNILG